MEQKLDRLLLSMNEEINHSRYEANEIIEVQKYISEKNSGVLNAIAGAKYGETRLLIAPTGSGKSCSIINALKTFKLKSLFVLPNSANVQQAMNEYDIHGAYDNLCPKNALKNGDVVVMTWDKVSQLKEEDLSEHIIVLDEIHQTYTDTYRNKAIKGLYDVSTRCKGRIDITATPNKLDFEIYDYITEYHQKEQTEYNVKMYDCIDTKAIIDILNKSNNGALLMNDTKELKYISSMLNKKSDVITADTKEHSKLYDKIMSCSKMTGYKVILNTTTLVAGVNINNPKITDIIVVGIKDIGTIKQYVARFRNLKKVNVHIFNNYKEDCEIYDIEWLSNQHMISAINLADSYNKESKKNIPFSPFGVNFSPLNIDTNVYYNKQESTYKADTIYVKSQTYKHYYNSRTFESFKVLLEEYFYNIELIYDLKIDEEIKEDKNSYKKELKELQEETIEQLEKHKDILVGYDEIKKNKRSYNLMEYQEVNNLSMEQVQKDYLKLGIHDLIFNNSLKSKIKLYSKYVLEDYFSTDMAWNIAFMGNRKRGGIFAKINTLIYRELKEEHPNIFKNDNTIEVRMYEWLTNEFKEGVSYTQEHLEILAESFRITFGDNWAFTSKKLSEILNQIYVVSSSQIKTVNPVETLFYRNIIPTALTNNKKTKINTIKSKIKLSDIKKELGCTSSNLSLDLSIKKRKSKLLNQLDDVEKKILLEGIF
ncbi:DEAD/DEAH box helicase family protein [Romboutsia sp. MSSM.1001216sp_RTP31141st1_G3_RTP31141_220114]|uniref:DEAD/DEAH box helicase family protein n=2 Tax=unclassified Romboutsia TaxID=2626894 RepID=UPI0031B57CCF